MTEASCSSLGVSIFTYIGMESKLIQTVLNSAIMLMIYERLVKLLLNMFRVFRSKTQRP